MSNGRVLTLGVGGGAFGARLAGARRFGRGFGARLAGARLLGCGLRLAGAFARRDGFGFAFRLLRAIGEGGCKYAV